MARSTCRSRMPCTQWIQGWTLGGPSFQSLWDSDPMMAWAGYSGVEDQSWLTRLLAYLNGRGRERDLAFVSFEWYPFDDICAPPGPHRLRRGPALLADALAELHDQGLPRDTPLLMTEYGYSAFATQAEVDLPGALFNADTVGTIPDSREAPPPICTVTNPARFTRGRTATPGGITPCFCPTSDGAFWPAPRLIMAPSYWPSNGPGTQPSRIGSIRRGSKAFRTDAALSAYSVKRPNGLWSVLLINKDPGTRSGPRIPLHWDRPGPDIVALRGPADLYQFSADQYRWRTDGKRSQPARDRPPAHTVLAEHRIWRAGEVAALVADGGSRAEGTGDIDVNVACPRLPRCSTAGSPTDPLMPDRASF